MSWVHLIDHDGKLDAIYGKECDFPTDIDLHEIVLSRNGPTASIRFDLSVYPVVPPPKWRAQGYNTVQLTMLIIGVEKIDLSGLATSMRGKINVDQRSQSRFDVHVTGEFGEAKIVGQAVRLNHVSAYRNLP